jgi:hypothetical protein
MISKELFKSWQRRNSGEPIAVKNLGLKGKQFILIDVDTLDKEAQELHKSLWDIFLERYPGVAGCAYITLPGSSKGETAAVVEITVSNFSYHSARWGFLVTKLEGR